jgi:predicted MFS family arabinose efflux permease
MLSGLADLFPRRHLMITLDLIRAGLVAMMALPGMLFPGMCTLFFATVLLGTPFCVARSALLAEVLPRNMLPAGSAIGNQTMQLGQVVGFLVGGGLVAWAGADRAIALDSLSFSLSALILACWVRPRPAPPRPAPPRSAPPPAASTAPQPLEITWDGLSTVFGRPVLRTLVLFGWLAGFAVVPEGLAAPYAHTFGGGPPAVGLLLAAMPAGSVLGAFLLGRLIRPADRLRPMGWLAMLSCAPLVLCQVHPSLPVVAGLWAVAGAGGAYQLAAVAAFVRALPRTEQERAFAVAQSGLLAAQVLGLLAAGAVAQRLGPQATVALAGLLGLVAAAVLATDWIHRHAEVLARLDAPQHPAARSGPASQAAHQATAATTQAAKASAKRPGGASDTLPDGSLRASAQLLGRSHAHRAPRDLPREARLAAARLLDQVLRDRRVLALFRDDDPPGQVGQRAHAECDHRHSHEDEPDQSGVDAGVLGDPGTDTGHQPTVPRPD